MNVLWVLSRATGLVSLALLTAVVVLGVLVRRRSTAGTGQRFVLVGLHRNASLLAVLLLVVHVATVVLDSYVSVRWYDALVPFLGGYHPFWLGLGTLSVDLVGLLVVTSLLRHRLPPRLWRAVHLSAVRRLAGGARPLRGAGDRHAFGPRARAGGGLHGRRVRRSPLAHVRAAAGAAGPPRRPAARRAASPSGAGPRPLPEPTMTVLDHTPSAGLAALPRLLRPADQPAGLAAHRDRHGELPYRGGAGLLLATLDEAALTGRGGAGFPAGRKWRAVAAGRGRAVVVANGAEGEPASSKDRVLLRDNPHLVLDGLQLAAAAVAADQAVLFVQPGADVRAAVDAALRERGAADRLPVGWSTAPDASSAGGVRGRRRARGRPRPARDAPRRVVESGRAAAYPGAERRDAGPRRADRALGRRLVPHRRLRRRAGHPAATVPRRRVRPGSSRSPTARR